jgi:hypothetical protein
MAITVDNLIEDGLLDIVVRSDSALDVTDEEYKEYLKTLDLGKLKFKEGDAPTIWVMKRKLNYRQKQKVDNSKIRLEKGEMQLQIGFMSEEVRMSLVDVKNPDHIPPEKRLVLKKTGDGIDENFLACLGDIVTELFTARQTYIDAKTAGVADLKKG